MIYPTVKIGELVEVRGLFAGFPGFQSVYMEVKAKTKQPNKFIATYNKQNFFIQWNKEEEVFRIVD